ncbi:MAG: hypothetical protein KTR31_16190, partial [Myxococcales bacterium]|nr:hypothetical protein [Myxococcales bacterium]
QAVLHRSWGMVDGMGVLPEELPEAPSARGSWAAVAAVAAVAMLVLTIVLWPASDEPDPGVYATFSPGRGGLWASFDVPEASLVTIVGQGEEGLSVILASHAADDKAPYAVGDGSYRVHVQGEGVLLAAHDVPLADLGDRLAAAQGTSAPLEALASALGAHAEVAWDQR